MRIHQGKPLFLLLQGMGYLLALVIAVSFSGAILPACFFIMHLLPVHPAITIGMTFLWTIIVTITLDQWYRFYSSHSDLLLNKWTKSYHDNTPIRKFNKYVANIEKAIEKHIKTHKNDPFLVTLKEALKESYLENMIHLHSSTQHNKNATKYDSSLFLTSLKKQQNDVTGDQPEIFKQLSNCAEKHNWQQIQYGITSETSTSLQVHLNQLKLNLDASEKTKANNDLADLLTLHLKLTLLKEYKKHIKPQKTNYLMLFMIVILALFVNGPNTSFGGMALAQFLLKNLAISPLALLFTLGFFYLGGLANVATYIWPQTKQFFSSSILGSNKISKKIQKQFLEKKEALFKTKKKFWIRWIEIIWVALIYGHFSYMCTHSLISTFYQYAPQWVLSQWLHQNIITIALTSLTLSVLFTLPTGRNPQKALNFNSEHPSRISKVAQVIMLIAAFGNALTVFIPAIRPSNFVMQALSQIVSPYSLSILAAYYLFVTYSSLTVVTYSFNAFAKTHLNDLDLNQTPLHQAENDKTNNPTQIIPVAKVNAY